jgi:hypothetical protein
MRAGDGDDTGGHLGCRVPILRDLIQSSHLHRCVIERKESEGNRCGILVRFMMGHWVLPDVGECSMMTDRLAARYNHSSVMASPPLKS